MINTIIFDLGGVLLNLDLQRSMESFGALGLDAKSWFTNESRENSAGGALCEGIVASKITDLYQTGKITTEEFLSEVLKGCRKGTTTKEVAAAWNAMLLDIPMKKLDVLKRLRRTGYKVYMLSNTNEEHWRYLEESVFPEPVLNYFDGIYLSQVLGMSKPDRRVFERVLKDIGSEAEECLFVDDTMANCKAAACLGLHTFKMEPNAMWDEETIRMHLD
jgi:putative hydrolase of the HAD superfamily